MFWEDKVANIFPKWLQLIGQWKLWGKNHALGMSQSVEADVNSRTQGRSRHKSGMTDWNQQLQAHELILK